jgi:hypothetical protein
MAGELDMTRMHILTSIRLDLDHYLSRPSQKHFQLSTSYISHMAENAAVTSALPPVTTRDASKHSKTHCQSRSLLAC